MTTEEIEFINKEVETARELHKMSKEGQIAALCDEAGCDDKVAKAHARQYVHGSWNPHPSERFKRWWTGRGWIEAEESTHRAWSWEDDNGHWRACSYVQSYNCEAVRVLYRAFLKRQRDELSAFKGAPDDSITF